MLSRLPVQLGLPLLRRIDPERAHAIALWALRHKVTGNWREPDDPRLTVNALGLTMRSPITLAAGFDKSAVALPGLAQLQLGGVEVGTVTRLPQPGNPRPRLFRSDEDQAIINRMGFNNDGASKILARLPKTLGPVPVGVNIGLNRSLASPLRDFPELVSYFAQRAAWITINVSSPNTPGLQTLQAPAILASILAEIRVRVPRPPPLLVKLSPDLAVSELSEIIEACVEADVSGLIIANTTVQRARDLKGRSRGESGGLSGRPLRDLADRMLERAGIINRGRLVLVGCGGIESGADIFRKLRLGASFVQLYSALSFCGPGLLPKLHRELLHEILDAGYFDLSDFLRQARTL